MLIALTLLACSGDAPVPAEPEVAEAAEVVAAPPAEAAQEAAQEAAEPCTLDTYAARLGAEGPPVEVFNCPGPKRDDAECEAWSTSLSLTGGSTLTKAYEPDAFEEALFLKGRSASEGWAVAQDCLSLPPELRALSYEQVQAHAGGAPVPLAGEWPGEPPAQARVYQDGDSLKMEVPSDCEGFRSLQVTEAGVWLKNVGSC